MFNLAAVHLFFREAPFQNSFPDLVPSTQPARLTITQVLSSRITGVQGPPPSQAQSQHSCQYHITFFFNIRSQLFILFHPSLVPLLTDQPLKYIDGRTGRGGNHALYLAPKLSYSSHWESGAATKGQASPT